MSVPDRTPRTQSERSAAMRERVLEATLDALAEVGWAGTTTIEVCRRANVSRGAQLHHFPSRADLIVGAADYLVAVSIARTRAVLEDDPAACSDTKGALRRLLTLFESREFVAGLELRLASRPDPDLRRRVRRLTRDYSDVLVRSALVALGADRLGPRQVRAHASRFHERVRGAPRPRRGGRVGGGAPRRMGQSDRRWRYRLSGGISQR